MFVKLFAFYFDDTNSQILPSKRFYGSYSIIESL